LVINGQENTVSVVDRAAAVGIATVPVGAVPVRIALSPGGLTVPGPGLTPDGVLAFFDQSVANGSLVGRGRGAWAPSSLQALRRMLLTARDLLKRGKSAAAARQLQAVAFRTDGLPRPADFVRGPAAPRLFDLVTALRRQLAGAN